MPDSPAKRRSGSSRGGRSTPGGSSRSGRVIDSSIAQDGELDAGETRDGEGTPGWLGDVAGLSFQEARTALQIAMARLQADDLEVEEMAGLYQRAEAYANRCEAVLQRVEQEVIEWEARSTSTSP